MDGTRDDGFAVAVRALRVGAWRGASSCDIALVVRVEALVALVVGFALVVMFVGDSLLLQL